MTKVKLKDATRELLKGAEETLSKLSGMRKNADALAQLAKKQENQFAREEERRRAEENHAGILQKGRKVDHRANGDKDQHREQFIFDARVEQYRQKALRAQHTGRGAARDLIDHRGQIGQDRAETDGQKQRGFIVLFDRQIDQHAGNDEHHQRFQSLRREQVQHAGKKLLQQSQNIHSESSFKSTAISQW